ncbi:MAG TPA: polyphosphate kinase 2 family protein [Alphaproteobacteria bacterium]|jgi:PPK2 family polyphosphate:nucleotide phosphotransferase|nr:polyphosphate kinase 2 family protein [Alphaproteobacteria bacterium]
MNLTARLKTLAAPCRVTGARGFRLRNHDPADTGGLRLEKKSARDLLEHGVAQLSTLQEMLYAQDRWAVLLIFQAMDAAGKDSAIKHVMSGVNPQGCEVWSFKAPSSEELDHDYMWRCARRLPERGRIGIFNRSYYEEVLVVRVHPELLTRQKLPPKLVSKRLWQERFEDVRNFERYLTRNGVLILKFFLNVSKDEQKRRFLARLDEPEKHWKFQPGDVAERHYWDRYMNAYEEMIRATSTPYAPWHVVPADNKWYTRLVVAAAVIEGLEGLNLSYPTIDPAARKRLSTVRAELEKD